MKPKNSALTLIVISAAFLAACAITPQQKANIVNAVTATSKGIVLVAQAYKGIGSPGLPVADKGTFDTVCSYAAQLQPQVGTILNTAIIDSGSPSTNAAIATQLAPNTIVTQGDVNTVYAAAALAAPTK